MIIDGIVELDDQEFADVAEEPADIWALRMRVIDSKPGAVEAMIDLCVAAAELVGDRYDSPEISPQLMLRSSRPPPASSRRQTGMIWVGATL